ncbi:MAG: hypothetical protein OXE96_06775 [Gemmatimonadetes bacterium]|nr:hypothetical protein [Gemmatimonadota bacterium]
MTPGPESIPLLRGLHKRVFAAEEVRAVLDAAFEELVAELRDRREPPHATCPIPIDLFSRALPQGVPGLDGHESGSRPEPVRLCRAFLLRRGASMAAPERHANSVQRLVSYRGRGWIHQGLPGSGPSSLLPRAIASPGLGDAADIHRFWDIVAPGVWHFPEADREEDWATVTFHSAAEDEIIDELWEG